MADRDSRRYYWLKLEKDFFKRHDIRIIEGMPNGKDYIIFYLKLLCEATSHEGYLRFSETIPYNENMLATITNTNVDIVRSAIKIFTELQMMQILDDGTYYFKQVEKMIGSETEQTIRKREARELKRYELGKGAVNLTLDIDKDIEIEKELDIDTHNSVCACEETQISNLQDLLNELQMLYGRCLTMMEQAQVEALSKNYDSKLIIDEIKNNLDKTNPIAYVMKKIQNTRNTQFNKGYDDNELLEDDWLKEFNERCRQEEKERKEQ